MLTREIVTEIRSVAVWLRDNACRIPMGGVGERTVRAQAGAIVALVDTAQPDAVDPVATVDGRRLIAIQALLDDADARRLSGDHAGAGRLLTAAAILAAQAFDQATVDPPRLDVEARDGMPATGQ